MHWFIIVINWVYSVTQFTQMVSWLAKNPKIVKHAFKIGWFANLYWLALGLYFGWYGNIVITWYFVWLNYYGHRQWGNKPINIGNAKYYLLGAALLATLITNIVTGQLFNNIPSTINTFNCMLYAYTYTLFAMGPKYQRQAQQLKLVNLIAYIPMVCMVQPLLWGCIIRQIIAIGLYVNKLWGKQIGTKVYGYSALVYAIYKPAIN